MKKKLICSIIVVLLALSTVNCGSDTDAEKVTDRIESKETESADSANAVTPQDSDSKKTEDEDGNSAEPISDEAGQPSGEAEPAGSQDEETASAQDQSDEASEETQKEATAEEIFDIIKSMIEVKWKDMTPDAYAEYVASEFGVEVNSSYLSIDTENNQYNAMTFDSFISYQKAFDGSSYKLYYYRNGADVAETEEGLQWGEDDSFINSHGGGKIGIYIASYDTVAELKKLIEDYWYQNQDAFYSKEAREVIETLKNDFGGKYFLELYNAFHNDDRYYSQMLMSAKDILYDAETGEELKEFSFGLAGELMNGQWGWTTAGNAGQKAYWITTEDGTEELLAYNYLEFTREEYEPYYDVLMAPGAFRDGVCMIKPVQDPQGDTKGYDVSFRFYVYE